MWGSRGAARQSGFERAGVECVCGVICAPRTPEPCSATVATSCAAPLITPHKTALASACRAAQDGSTGLIAASDNGHVKTIELLLDRHANIHATGGKVICARHAYAGRQVEQGSPSALAGSVVLCVGWVGGLAAECIASGGSGDAGPDPAKQRAAGSRYLSSKCTRMRVRLLRRGAAIPAPRSIFTVGWGGHVARRAARARDGRACCSAGRTCARRAAGHRQHRRRRRLHGPPPAPRIPPCPFPAALFGRRPARGQCDEAWGSRDARQSA